MSEPATILVVEDELPTRTFLADNLTADGYELLVAGTVRDALRTLEYHEVDVVVLDLGLPDGSGLELLRAVRESDGPGSRLDSRVPVVVLSGRADEPDRVRGFERGADDFVSKPFGYGELRLRIAAVLRRATERPLDGRLRVGQLTVDPVSREVRVHGERVALSQKEFALLRVLATAPTRVWTKAELLRDIWGYRALGHTRTLGLARLPAAAQAGRPRRPLRRQRLGRGLPAARRRCAGGGGRGHRAGGGGGGGMTAVLAAAGWIAALGALLTAACLRASLDRRMSLVAQAAHELRGPLSAALLGLHGVGAGSAAARRVAAVQLELRRAGLALEDLHAAPHGRRAPELAEPVDVGALVAEAAEAWAPLAGALGSELLVVAPGGRLIVRADRLRLAQALGNLVVNALEHGAGPVRIRVHDAAGRVRVEVRDHGPGLPAPAAAAPRGGANRREAASPPSAGTAPWGRVWPAAADAHAGRRGHGLAIAARVAESHGGRLVSAPVTAGACLVLELPADAGRRHAASARGAAGCGRASRAPRPHHRPVSRRRRALLLLGLAVVLGGLAWTDVARREAALRRQLGPAVRVVVARVDLGAGRKVRAADLALREVPARYAPVGAAELPEMLVGRRLAAAVPRGGFLGAGQIETAVTTPGPQVRRGERAADVVAVGAASLVVPGVRVDVLVTRDGGGTQLALQDVEVLAAAPAPDAAAGRPGERVQATLRVRLQEAVFLAAAQSFAREVRLLPRAAGDHARAAAVEIGAGLR